MHEPLVKPFNCENMVVMQRRVWSREIFYLATGDNDNKAVMVPVLIDGGMTQRKQLSTILIEEPHTSAGG
jgi:hypothetical protein